MYVLAAGQRPQHLLQPFGHEYINEGVHQRAEIQQRVGHQAQVPDGLLQGQSSQEDADDEGRVEEGVVDQDHTDAPRRSPLLCAGAAEAVQGPPPVHREEEQEGERSEQSHSKPQLVVQHGEGQDGEGRGPGYQRHDTGVADAAAAGPERPAGDQQVALLSYYEHHGDVGGHAEVEDEFRGTRGEERRVLSANVYVGTTQKTDDVRHQQELGLDGNFGLTCGESADNKMILMETKTTGA